MPRENVWLVGRVDLAGLGLELDDFLEPFGQASRDQRFIESPLHGVQLARAVNQTGDADGNSLAVEPGPVHESSAVRALGGGRREKVVLGESR